MNPTIACHDNRHQRINQNSLKWRDVEPSPRKDGSEGRPFRTCSYCGSIHPQDLLDAIKAGAVLGGADWKYGWPHKFYISNIPNPHQGAMVRKTSGGSYKSEAAAREAGLPYVREGYRLEVKEGVTPDPETLTFNMNGQWSFEIYEPAGAFTHGKWYNDHLSDELTDAEFNELAAALEAHAGIKFEFVVDGDGNKRLKYGAPYAGFQK